MTVIFVWSALIIISVYDIFAYLRGGLKMTISSLIYNSRLHGTQQTGENNPSSAKSREIKKLKKENQSLRGLLRENRELCVLADGAFTKNWAMDFGKFQIMIARIDEALGEGK
jgi:hypothetical protein